MKAQVSMHVLEQLVLRQRWNRDLVTRDRGKVDMLPFLWWGKGQMYIR